MADQVNIPADDLSRQLVDVRADSPEVQHIGLVGDTYTVLLSGKDTAGRYCLIDMLVPPGGGPPPHRHDFEETFVVQEGAIVASFRGEKRTVGAGETLHIPANAPHQFRNEETEAARLLCICSPAGQEEFFALVGVPVATRSTAPPKLSEAEQKASQEKARRLAPEYATEMLDKA